MQPIGRLVGSVDLSPNILTTISLIIAAGASAAYALRWPVVGAFVLIVSGFVDMLDGAVARATRNSSKFGAVYDHTLDRYVEFLVLVGIGLSGFVNWILVIFCLFGMVMASFVRAKAESVGGLKSCTVGIAERQEKLIILLIGSALQLIVPVALTVSLFIIGVLSHLTVLQRLLYTRNHSRG